MNRDEFIETGMRLYGRGWQTKLAASLGVDGSTVRRWVAGSVPVPGPVAAAVKCFVERA